MLKVAGFATCGAFKQAAAAVRGLSAIFPDRFHCDVKEFESRDAYMEWLPTFRTTIGAPEHKTSPIVWFDEGNRYLGGRDDTIAWCKSVISMTGGSTQDFQPLAFDPQHGFDYDVIVIGGGSGGLACSKEAKKFVPKVAVLDFVKPSPQGTKWGLGGTCVNVGCIPKKLMHTAALLGEAAHDAVSYGWEGGKSSTHNWETMKNNVQDHIKGLNFGYRVQLREQGVDYLNKLGRFVGPNTLECTDKNGKVDTITAAKFVIAVGGRPSPLQCPGGELAITSDDLFSKATSPGKTCVVGAGYVALECAGFIHGLKQGEVTVLVRSMPLRGFDRDIVAPVQTFMETSGVKIVVGVTPEKVVKLPSGRLEVTYSDGNKDEFDTVLCAIGRYADLTNLGIDSLGLATNPKTGKLICSNEATSAPNVYAIGDVVDGAPELTPVAIMAGRLLARRLFNAGTQTMDYKTVATAVFTPLEIGTVGLTEDEAIEKYGADSVDAYVSSFTPLEWSVVHKDGVNCFSKVVVNTKDNNKVLGLHIASPNAGEIIQGFSAAFRKGLTYQDLIDTVGIHPTVAEEFTTMEIAKSSGKSTEKSGC